MIIYIRQMKIQARSDFHFETKKKIHKIHTFKYINLKSFINILYNNQCGR